jgi:hypothetical protein
MGFGRRLTPLRVHIPSWHGSLAFASSLARDPGFEQIAHADPFREVDPHTLRYFAPPMDRFEEMRVFVRIAERQSFTHASDDLQIPRATVTNGRPRARGRRLRAAGWEPAGFLDGGAARRPAFAGHRGEPRVSGEVWVAGRGSLYR